MIVSNDFSKTANYDWALGNAWLWMGIGLGCCSLAWLWMGVLGPNLPAGRFTLLIVGLLSTAVSVIIRLRFTQPAFLSRMPRRGRNFILTAVGLLLGGVALAVSVLLLLAFLRADSVSWRWGPLLIVWIALVPTAEFAALQSFRRLKKDEPLSEREEAAALLLLAALACFVSMRALLDPQDVFAMDSMRVFLSALALVPLGAAPLVLVPQELRRKIISFLVLVHFAGVMTIPLVVVHPPWAIRQLVDRIYRPYLQFIYVTNAYHFYAPEPGPNSYMWMRIHFVDAAGHETGQWLKVPELDADTGLHSYPTALTYVRHMCLMERAAPSPSPPATAFVDAATGMPLEFYRRRLLHTPGMFYLSQSKYTGPSETEPVASIAEQRGKTVVHATARPAGAEANKSSASKPAQGELGTNRGTDNRLMIPWHPQFTHDQQFRRPDGQPQALLRSYARHVLSKAELSADGKLVFKSWFGRDARASDRWKAKSVKLYYVTHAFLAPETYRMGVDEPWDPHTYRGFFLGEFDVDGNLLSGHDPFLYWMLPVIRETQERDSVYRDYIRRHAGDPAWVRNDKKQWGPDPDENP